MQPACALPGMDVLAGLSGWKPGYDAPHYSRD